MAKTFTLWLIVLMTALPSFAQKIRFNDTTNIWITCSSDPYTWMVDKYGNTIKPSSTRRITKDSLVNGYTWYYHNRYNVWIRAEDTTEQKFYFTSVPGSTEHIFMDFTMNIGDTLRFLNGANKLTLAAIDSVLINGVYHRLQSFGGSTAGTAILEGVGPAHATVDGLEFPYHPICCFQTHGQRPALPSPSWFDNVSSCVTSVNEVETNTHATIAPNPVTADSRIILPHTITQGTLTITNSIGQTIVSREIKNEINIPLPLPLPAGVYFYRVTNTTIEKNYSGKFIAE